MEAITVPELLEKTARAHPERPALRVKVYGEWETITWGAYYEKVRRAARAFIRLGLEPGNCISIMGYNRPAWLISDLGAILAGGIPAGIYTTNSPEQCHYIAEHSESVVAVVQNREQLEKFLAIRDDLPKLETLILMYGEHPDPDVLSWDEFLALGEEVPEKDLEARIEAQDPDDVCTLIYTSGTTGPPKAVMISHDNFTWTARSAMDIIGADEPDQILSYLPLSHVAEQLMTIYGPMVSGGCVWFAESIPKIGQNLREVRPTLFLGVPRIWEKMQARIQQAAAKNSLPKRLLGKWARKIGLRGGYADQEGEPRPAMWSVADRLVFQRVRRAIGLDRCRFQVTSAAPISRDTLEFFLSLGLPIYEIYGMSESTGPTTVSLPDAYRTGWVGQVLPGAEMKVAEDGELLIRGRHVFKGYLRNEEATNETIDDEGWLHTGDIGEIDPDGYIRITDRKKDLLITAGGENIAPQVIENKLKAIPLVHQVVVVGDRRKFLGALLTLDAEVLPSVATEVGSSATSLTEAAECDVIRAHLQGEVEKANVELARVQTIKRFRVLPGEFTIEGGELTPTMKIKRRVVRDKFEDEIEAIYAGT